ncbi:hypothetical protein BD311DRAFT_678949 [Dichomitus squalens]|uniref:TPR-like protein n=1 Tax=Dichomitus squalens TaxID=114155 RepID=A0A4Q9M4Q2_9APHY|nr:hypothetical protein BD311DRAFT_678949 [Dichomitus squalens]
MDYAAACRTRYNRRRSSEDLQTALALLEKAVRMCPVTEASRPHLLNNLGLSLRSRYDDTGDKQALDSAIHSFREALKLRPRTHPDRCVTLGSLANSLRERYKRFGHHIDLDESIAKQREALDLRAEDHADRWMTQSNLGNALLLKYKTSGEPQDILEAIAAIQSCPPDHRSANPLANLARALRVKFSILQRHGGNLEDIDEAITLNRKAISLQRNPPDDDNLTNALLERFENTGDTRDSNEAIQYLRDALRRRSGGPSRASSLHNLGVALGFRDDQTRNRGDLDEAIQLHREALDLRPPGHAERFMSLSMLGIFYKTLFHLGDSASLERAIAAQREALDCCPEDRLIDYSQITGHLGSALLEKHRSTHNKEDLDYAINALNSALGRLPASHSLRRISLVNAALAHRSKLPLHDEDLERIISYQHEASELFPLEHPLQSVILARLATALLHRSSTGQDPFIRKNSLS